MQQASELKNVQKKLGCERAALGSLFEAATVFDAERLVEIIQELNGQLTPTHGGKDPRLAHLPGTLTLVDATLISAMPRIMTASVMKQSGGSGLVPMSFPTKWCCSAHPAKRPIAPTIPCDWSSSRFGRTSREGNTREDHRVSIAMASCELRQTCSTFPPRSSRSCTLTVGRLKSSSGSSSICWAAVTC